MARVRMWTPVGFVVAMASPMATAIAMAMWLDECGVCGGDGSCQGCTDPNACNYEPGALVDDGSCITEGCNDEAACNFNPMPILVK